VPDTTVASHTTRTPLSRLILASGLGPREIQRRAGLPNHDTVTQARDGADVRLSTARKILHALGKSFADLDREG
jgi:predicted transcriptional regulator